MSRPGRLTLRARMTLIAALAVAVGVVAVSLAAFVIVRDQLNRQVDSKLTHDAVTVAAEPQKWMSGHRPHGTDPDDDRDRDLLPWVQVLDGGGHRIGGTAWLPVTAATWQVVRRDQGSRYDEIHLGGRDYRMLTWPCRDGRTVQIATSLSDQERTLQGFGATMLGADAAGILAAALLGWWVARSGLRPVHRLTDAVEHVATTTDLSRRIEVTGRDEVGRLATAFNGMLAALGSSRAAQRLLVEDASHELRTPLTSLRTNIELLIRSEASTDSRRLGAADRSRLLADVGAQMVELSTLIAELVELAREDADPEPVEPLDLAEVVYRAAHRVRERRAGGQPAITLDLVPVRMSGRPASLDRLVANLLDNAVKWSPPEQPVRVRLRLRADEAVLTVADAGPGIDDADLPRIFERFYRAPGARSVPGSGLGLAIAAQAVALPGGRVTAGRSAAAGAEFTVRLPVSGQSSSSEPGAGV